MSTRTIAKLKKYLDEKDKQIATLTSENEKLKKELEETVTKNETKI